jgi:hypothetical protein
MYKIPLVSRPFADHQPLPPITAPFNQGEARYIGRTANIPTVEALNTSASRDMLMSRLEAPPARFREEKSRDDLHGRQPQLGCVWPKLPIVGDIIHTANERAASGFSSRGRCSDPKVSGDRRKYGDDGRWTRWMRGDGKLLPHSSACMVRLAIVPCRS